MAVSFLFFQGRKAILPTTKPLCFVSLLALAVFCHGNARAQGNLTNGWTHTGSISPVGDSDTWTFTANAGDSIMIRVGEISQTGSFTPRIRLQNPSAVLIASASGAVAANVSVTATNTGTFTVIVDDVVGTSATGNYRITLAKAPGAVFVAPSDEGGPLINGAMHTGTIDVGDLDVWTFSANSGDSIQIRMGETVSGSPLTPALWLYGPNGVLLDSYGASGAASEVSFQATNSGTFTVIAGDFSSGFSGSGAYRLTLAKTGDPVVTSAGDEGGPLTNGVMHTGTIDVGDLDVWTFSANSGDNIQIRMGEMVSGSTLTPALWLYGPNGALLDSYGASAAAAEVSFRATNSGTFTVVAGDFSSFYTGSGTYRLTLAKTGDPIVTSTGDEGGPMTNGVVHTGTIDVGDLDVWNFNANTGDSIVLRMGETVAGSTLTPAIWLYGPGGARLAAYGSSAVASEVTVRATNSGTFTVVVSDFSSFYTGSGAYRLTLAKTGDPIVVSPGDEGGPMTNGVMYTDYLNIGDIDIWNFTASAGDSIQIRMGDITNSTLTPSLRLYGPNGALLDTYGSSGAASEVSLRATNSGTFTIIASDVSSFYAGSGAYRLKLAKTGDPIVVSPGDQGGPLTNGLMHTGVIDIGDLDIWNFTANSGDSLILRMGDLTNGASLTPALWLYGPDGALLATYGSSSIASEVSFRATNSGTFTVVASDFSSFYTGTGAYRLTLAKTGSPVFVSPGDEGGALNGANTYDGDLESGDLDVFYFTACTGDILSFQMDELVLGSSLTPWLRLYGRSGILLRSLSGASTAQFNLVATNSGTFILVASDFSSFYSGSGTYRLTVNGLSAGLKLCTPSISGTNVNITGISESPGGTFRLYTTTNVTTPLNLWTPLTTNQFDLFGTFGFTNFFDRNETQRYFRLFVP